MEVVAGSRSIEDEIEVEKVVSSAKSSGVVLFKRLDISKQVLRTAKDVNLVHVQLPDVHVKDTFW